MLSELDIPVEEFDARLVSEMVYSCVRLYSDKHNTGQLKLINHTLKEMRYAYRVFNRYVHDRRLSIFGSARTPEDHPDYIAAKEFSEKLTREGWMCITGAAHGIMKAGHEGAQKEASFGLSIDLAFEDTANAVIEGDPKHINFKYFFTRKLMFLTHSEAAAVFPGGVGTMDELFEVLTLMQTGKSNIIPVVLVEGPKGDYWKGWLEYVHRNLLEKGMISADDLYLFHLATDVDDAVDHIRQFYRRYHSSRFVRDKFVIRMNSPISAGDLEVLNSRFGKILVSGKIEQTDALPEERAHEELPRLVFHFNRRSYGTLRHLIDTVNRF